MTGLNNLGRMLTLPDCNARIREIEAEVGALPDATRALLVTDGSVTSLLECFSGAPITINTLTQEIIPADGKLAADLILNPGDQINHRIVELADQETGIPLVYAVSFCPVDRLPNHAKISLMQADIPIGHILRDNNIESRREITSIRVVNQAGDISARLGVGPGERLLSRSYRIVHQDLPLFRIEEFLPDTIFGPTERVTIRTPSRLHLGLIDMNGSSGRVDGGIGITLDRPGYVIEAEPADRTMVLTDDPELESRVLSILNRIAEQTGYRQNLTIRMRESVPAHSGLGSGTQLSLALATAILAIAGEDPEKTDLPRMTGRGGTSGIGVRAFSEGGVILDAGHRFGPGKEKETFLPSSASPDVRAAPLIGRYEFPSDWRIILCLPDLTPGASGQGEVNIFQQHCPIPIGEVQQITHLLLMQMIPALLEEDIGTFGKALSTLQCLGFKKRELDLQPPELHEILDHMSSCGSSVGAGMSSFGPALFAVTDSGEAALADEIRSYLNDRCGGKVQVVRGKNRGAVIRSRS